MYIFWNPKYQLGTAGHILFIRGGSVLKTILIPQPLLPSRGREPSLINAKPHPSSALVALLFPLLYLPVSLPRHNPIFFLNFQKYH